MTTVTVTPTTNRVAFTNATTRVTPVTIDHQVTVDNVVQNITVDTKQVTLSLVNTPLSVNVQNVQTKVVSAAIQGPQGPAGAGGGGDEIAVLNKAERSDTVEDSPSAGDITVYYAIAAPQTAEASLAWLVTRTIYLADGGAFDSSKTFASLAEDQDWTNHLTHTYT